MTGPAPFRYESFELDPERGLLSCRYSVGDRQFEERVTFDPGGRWDDPAAEQAARLVFLLAGVSYYKTAAPPVIDLGTTAVTDSERRFLRSFYLDSEALLAQVITEGQQAGVFRRELDPRVGAWELIRSALGYTLRLAPNASQNATS